MLFNKLCGNTPQWLMPRSKIITAVVFVMLLVGTVLILPRNKRTPRQQPSFVENKSTGNFEKQSSSGYEFSLTVTGSLQDSKGAAGLAVVAESNRAKTINEQFAAKSKADHEQFMAQMDADSAAFEAKCNNLVRKHFNK